MLWWGTTSWVASLIITIGLFFVIYQTIKCLEYPGDKNRRRHLFLLCLILLHNIIVSFLPDKKLNIPVAEQQLLCYAGKLIVLAYCPFYLYQSFDISALRFYARCGIWLFLMGPIIVSISCTDSVLICVRAAIISYSFISICTIGSALYKKYKNQALDSFKEALLLFLAIGSWGLAFMLSSEISPLGVLILSNMGFLPFCILNVREEFRLIRNQESRIQAINLDLEEKELHIRVPNDASVENELGIQVLSEGLAEKEPRIQQLEHDLTELKSHVQTLNFNVEEKESHIEALEKEITEKDAKISQLNYLLESAKKTDVKNVQSMSETIAERDAELLQLRKVLGEIEKEDVQQPSTCSEKTDEDAVSGTLKASFDENCKKQHLTKAQTDVIKLVNEGVTYKEIAHIRGIATSSVQELVSSVGERLKVKGKANILRKLNS